MQTRPCNFHACGCLVNLTRHSSRASNRFMDTIATENIPEHKKTFISELDDENDSDF